MSLKEKFLSWLGSFGDDQIRSATDLYDETCDRKLPPGAVVLSRPKKEYGSSHDMDSWFSISNTHASMKNQVTDVGPILYSPDLDM